MPLPTHILLFSLLISSLFTPPSFSLYANKHDSPEWDEFGSSDFDEELDPGSWRPIFEPESSAADSRWDHDALYYAGLSKLVKAASSGDALTMDEASAAIESTAASGHPHYRSILGFLHAMGQRKERDMVKAFLYHYFAAEGGNTQSKMALAYTYFNQEVRTVYSPHSLFFFFLFFFF